jgi:hypothetical protein
LSVLRGLLAARSSTKNREPYLTPSIEARESFRGAKGDTGVFHDSFVVAPLKLDCAR